MQGIRQGRQQEREQLWNNVAEERDTWDKRDLRNSPVYQETKKIMDIIKAGYMLRKVEEDTKSPTDC